MVEQDNSNPFDTYHVSPLTYDKQGRPIAEAPFTATTDAKRHAVIIPPSKVIPVILIPGIMGSNLRLNTLPDGFAQKRYTTDVQTGWHWPPVQTTTEGWGDRAWRPDDGVSFMARRFWPLEAYERRRLLDPENTQVDDRAAMPAKLLQEFVFDSAGDGRDQASMGEQRKRGFTNEMTRRGWGTVMLSSYGPLLAFLEKNLNQMYAKGELSGFWSDNILQRRHVIASGRGTNATRPSNWGITKGDKQITAEDVKKAARYWLPVHAIGYNWTQSNGDGAKHVVRKIDEFIGHYKSLGYECDKVLLVTHSMGGLVARAAVHPELGGAADKVLGIIHGVMPTHGAAAAYRRCHTGFEGAGYAGKGPVTANILGRDGREVAAVFSNSPGALQLLPNKLYGQHWLQLQDYAGRPLLSLPNTDPYSEIYQRKDVWWRLMNPEWVNPVPGANDTDLDEAWGGFVKNLSKAQSFHEMLDASHHLHTQVHYGADDGDNRAFGSLIWKAVNGFSGFTGSVLDSASFGEALDGAVRLRDVRARDGMAVMPARFALSGKDEAGDGTVPRRSAAALNDQAQLVAEHAGYEHQDSYQDRRAQELVAYGLVRLIAENTP